MDMTRHLFQATVMVVGMLCSGYALATDFEVARVKMSLPGDGWTQLESADKQLSYGGDFHGELGTVRKTFVKKSDAQAVQAVVVVVSSSSSVDTGRGTMSYSPKCEGTKEFYADGNSGFSRSFAKCLRVTKLFSASSLLGAIAPDVQQRLVADGAVVPESMRAFMALYANSFGIFLDVSVLVPSAFPGLGSDGDDANPPGIGARNVRWGDAMMEAVQGGVNSMSGEVKLPSFDD
jgi:hypothetical protein